MSRNDMRQETVEEKIVRIKRQNEEIRRREQKILEDKKFAEEQGADFKAKLSDDKWPREKKDSYTTPTKNNIKSSVQSRVQGRREDFNSPRLPRGAVDGPPPDPKSFLADDERDYSEPPPHRFESTEKHSRQDDQRGRKSDRQRGGSKGGVFRRLGDVKEKHWRDERKNVDDERLQRHRTSEGNWKREWDQEKIEDDELTVPSLVQSEPRKRPMRGLVRTIVNDLRQPSPPVVNDVDEILERLSEIKIEQTGLKITKTILQTDYEQPKEENIYDLQQTPVTVNSEHVYNYQSPPTDAPQQSDIYSNENFQGENLTSYPNPVATQNSYSSHPNHMQSHGDGLNQPFQNQYPSERLTNKSVTINSYHNQPTQHQASTSANFSKPSEHLQNQGGSSNFYPKQTIHSEVPDGSTYLLMQKQGASLNSQPNQTPQNQIPASLTYSNSNNHNQVPPDPRTYSNINNQVQNQEVYSSLQNQHVVSSTSFAYQPLQHHVPISNTYSNASEQKENQANYSRLQNQGTGLSSYPNQLVQNKVSCSSNYANPTDNIQNQSASMNAYQNQLIQNRTTTASTYSQFQNQDTSLNTYTDQHIPNQVSTSDTFLESSEHSQYQCASLNSYPNQPVQNQASDYNTYSKYSNPNQDATQNHEAFSNVQNQNLQNQAANVNVYPNQVLQNQTSGSNIYYSPNEPLQNQGIILNAYLNQPVQNQASDSRTKMQNQNYTLQNQGIILKSYPNQPLHDSTSHLPQSTEVPYSYINEASGSSDYSSGQFYSVTPHKPVDHYTANKYGYSQECAQESQQTVTFAHRQPTAQTFCCQPAPVEKRRAITSVPVVTEPTHNYVNSVPVAAEHTENYMNSVPVVTEPTHNYRNSLPIVTEPTHNYMNSVPVVTEPTHNYRNSLPIVTEPTHNYRNSLPIVTEPSHNYANSVPVAAEHTENYMNSVPVGTEHTQPHMNSVPIVTEPTHKYPMPSSERLATVPELPDLSVPPPPLPTPPKSFAPQIDNATNSRYTSVPHFSQANLPQHTSEAEEAYRSKYDSRTAQHFLDEQNAACPTCEVPSYATSQPQASDNSNVAYDDSAPVTTSGVYGDHETYDPQYYVEPPNMSYVPQSSACSSYSEEMPPAPQYFAPPNESINSLYYVTEPPQPHPSSSMQNFSVQNRLHRIQQEKQHKNRISEPLQDQHLPKETRSHATGKTSKSRSFNFLKQAIQQNQESLKDYLNENQDVANDAEASAPTQTCQFVATPSESRDDLKQHVNNFIPNAQKTSKNLKGRANMDINMSNVSNKFTIKGDDYDRFHGKPRPQQNYSRGQQQGRMDFNRGYQDDGAKPFKVGNHRNNLQGSRQMESYLQEKLMKARQDKLVKKENKTDVKKTSVSPKKNETKEKDDKPKERVEEKLCWRTECENSELVALNQHGETQADVASSRDTSVDKNQELNEIESKDKENVEATGEEEEEDEEWEDLSDEEDKKKNKNKKYGGRPHGGFYYRY